MNNREEYNKRRRKLNRHRRRVNQYGQYVNKIINMSVKERQKFLVELYRSNLYIQQLALIFNCNTKIIYKYLKIQDIKKCDQCKEYKSYSNFSTSHQNKNTGTCRNCLTKNTSIWKKDNPEKTKKHQRTSDKNKLSTVSGKINHSMNVGIRSSLKNNKNGSWKELVNYTINDLKIHLESLFDENVSWDNYGQWHIDHIIPKSYFNIIDYKCNDFKKCWSLDNLQPLWAEDNFRKNDKLPDGSLGRNKIG